MFSFLQYLNFTKARDTSKTGVLANKAVKLLNVDPQQHFSTTDSSAFQMLLKKSQISMKTIQNRLKTQIKLQM